MRRLMGPLLLLLPLLGVSLLHSNITVGNFSLSSNSSPASKLEVINSKAEKLCSTVGSLLNNACSNLDVFENSPLVGGLTTHELLLRNSGNQSLSYLDLHVAPCSEKGFATEKNLCSKVNVTFTVGDKVLFNGPASNFANNYHIPLNLSPDEQLSVKTSITVDKSIDSSYLGAYISQPVTFNAH